MSLEILQYPHSVLKEKAEAVKIEEIKDLKNTFEEMISLMKEANGMGLAAIQVGIKKRFFIMSDDEVRGKEAEIVIAINPEIINEQGEVIDEEGCLSFPGVSANVKRAEKVTMKALNENGEEFTLERSGYLARCIQHEIDHLNGITYFDYLGPLKRKMIEKKYNKLMKRNSK